MIGSKDKNFSKNEINTNSTVNVDLKKSELKYLPRYICYKAALLKEKIILTYVIVVMGLSFISYFIISRFEIAKLYERLRTKEYILAPGVQDFTIASPQSIPDSYVHDAVSDFLSSLGNVNSSNIVEEYEGLKRFMSSSFKIQFDAETKDWIKQVRKEDLAQILKVKNKKIISDQNGNYQITAMARADFYVAGQYLGHENQVIEMELNLIPPDREKRWYLQINKIIWSKLEDFKTKNDYKNQVNKD